VELQWKTITGFVAKSNMAMKRWAKWEAAKEERLEAEEMTSFLGEANKAVPEQAREPSWDYNSWFGARSFSDDLPADVRIQFEAMLKLCPLPTLSPLFSKVLAGPDGASLASLVSRKPSRWEAALMTFAASPRYKIDQLNTCPLSTWMLLVKVLQVLIPERERQEQIGKISRAQFMNTGWCSVGQILRTRLLLEEAFGDSKVTYQDVLEELKQVLFDGSELSFLVSGRTASCPLSIRSRKRSSIG
jgi:hypothetical protein